ncbi:MAG TPA: glycosyltransferase [Spirochaetota bacterium]|nr:glycosyltransferase [Spirochaetota bacterium]HOL57717.1 glycosyltransferase [Spirochaetota bacterium]HPP04510.1 glycosyltransferase [Spirochaetota bacterium]
MKILKINYYPQSYINYVYKKYKNLSNKDYDTQLKALFYESYAWGDSWTYYLKPLGYETKELIYNAIPLQKRWLSENGLKKDFNLNEIIIKQIENFKPEILWYDHYDSELLKLIKEKCEFIKLIINWVGSAITNYEVFKLSDLILSCARESVEILEKEGFKCYHLDHAFDSRILERVNTNYSKTKDVIFIGQLIKTNQYHIEREKFLEQLCSNLNIKIYTPTINEYKFSIIKTLKTFIKRFFYSLIQKKKFHFLQNISFFKKISSLKSKPEYNFKFQFSKNLQRVLRPGLFGLEMFEKIAESKIVLNIHADTSPLYASNMRLFEVTGMGSLLLTDWKKNISDFFEEDKEVITYKNYNEAIDKIKWLITNPDKLEEIARNGKNKTLTIHNFNNRIRELDRIIRENI